MNKKLKSLIVVSVLATLVVVSALTGCSNKGSSSTNSKTAEVNSKPTKIGRAHV